MTKIKDTKENNIPAKGLMVNPTNVPSDIKIIGTKLVSRVTARKDRYVF